jgi:hypothetical protein
MVPWVQSKRFQNPDAPRPGTGRGTEYLKETRSLVIKL